MSPKDIQEEHTPNAAGGPKCAQVKRNILRRKNSNECFTIIFKIQHPLYILVTPYMCLHVLENRNKRNLSIPPVLYKVIDLTDLIIT